MRVAHALALAACVVVPFGAPLQAQSAKKPITQDTYDIWRSAVGTTISADGRWVAYTVTPVVGDGELVVRSTQGSTEWRVPRGWTGRPNTTVSAGRTFMLPAPQISADGRWAAAISYAPKAAYDSARTSRRRDAEPKPRLTLVRLEDGRVSTIPSVRAFTMPARAGRWLIYHLESADSASRGERDSTAAPGAAAATPGGQARPIADSASRGARRRTTGTPLVIRDLVQGGEVRVADVTSYVVDDAGRWLAYAVASADSTRDGVYARELATGRELALATGPGTYKQLVFDDDATQLAFVTDRDVRDTTSKRRFAVYHARLGSGVATTVVVPHAFGEAERIADGSRLSFTKDGSALLFGVQPVPPDSIPADSLAEMAVFDLWHWKDDRLQPQQRVEAARDRNRAYTVIHHLRQRRTVRLANDTLPTVVVSRDGRIALAESSAPYQIQRMWGDGAQDVYLIDARTGEARRIAEALPFGASLSPAGKYVLYFTEGRWFAHDVASGRAVDLTGGITGVRFDRETWDTPSTPPAWGVAGWTPDDRRVLLYDRYDIWEVDPSGRQAPRMLTDSVGVLNRLTLRVARVDREDETLDPAKPLLLRAMDERTKATGFWRDRIGVTAPPERIVMDDVAYGMPQKARDAEMYVVTRETLQEAPNLWVGPSLDRLTKISDVNPQQAEYPWPTVELVSWISGDGVPLQGLLFKPEGFDERKQYPMLVYFYERLSDNLHSYVAPAGRNTINPVVYTSRGYLVFFPDIAYRDGYPGMSAFHSIVPGVQSLIARGFVDPNAIGLGGQSWGGYQTAFLITRTNLFRAAFAGAPVANMTSAYGGIRWDSGLARAFQYERTQSRIGGSLWEYPWRYIENSPLFAADRIETPLLMMHNDDDGAVPWYQGIEMFVALRRLGKEVYLVNYNGDGHNPRKRANQKDIDMRMQQFFDHHLRGAPAPEWMREGIPFLRKGRERTPIAAEATTTQEPVAAPVAPAAQEPGAPSANRGPAPSGRAPAGSGR